MLYPNEPRDPLDPLLDRLEPPEPSTRLKAEVWRRIALGEEHEAERLSWFGWLEAWLTRPPVAVLFVACCTFIGLFFAEVRVNRMERERTLQLARSYLQLVDPLLKEEPAQTR